MWRVNEQNIIYDKQKYNKDIWRVKYLQLYSAYGPSNFFYVM